MFQKGKDNLRLTVDDVTAAFVTIILPKLGHEAVVGMK